MRAVHEIQAFAGDTFIVCPECENDIDNYIDDPRGKIVTCPICGEEFRVDSAASIELV